MMNSMKRRVIELVREVVNKYASTTTPTFDEICSSLGLNVVEDVLPGRKEGMYVEKEKTIFIDSRMQNAERKRFTQFHEVTHFLLKQDEDLISELDEYINSQADGYSQQIEEYLCNVGAAEFLMPSKEFVKLYEERGFNVQLILFAADYFESSTIAATIQLAQVARNKCIAVVCENGLVPNAPAPSQASFFTTGNQYHNKSKLHVIYSASSPAASDRWLAKYTVIPDDHIIKQAFRQSKMLEDDSEIPFPGWQEPCTCEALRYKNRVYALFHLSPLSDPNQKTLF